MPQLVQTFDSPCRPIQVFPFAVIGADCAIHQVCTIVLDLHPVVRESVTM